MAHLGTEQVDIDTELTASRCQAAGGVMAKQNVIIKITVQKFNTFEVFKNTKFEKDDEYLCDPVRRIIYRKSAFVSSESATEEAEQPTF